MTFRIAHRLAGVNSSPVRDLLAILSRGEVISFAGGTPDAQLFDSEALRACFERVLTETPHRALQYSATQGEPELREQAALRLSRQLPTGADDLLVTSGSQEGLYLAATALLDAGDLVLVEEPTYLAALQAFSLAGARVVAVHSDDEGMLPDALQAAIAQHRPKFVYLVPNFANPSGRSISAPRRAELAHVLLRTGTPLLEDDPYGALSYDGESPAPIAALEGMAAQTILLNSASKIMAPGVRIGWVRAQGPVARAMEIAKQAVGLQSAVTDQLAVASYLASGRLDAHLARVRAVYRVRRDAMVDGLTALLPTEATTTHPSGGMFCWVRLGRGDTAATLPKAVAAGVAYVPGAPFFATGPDRDADHSTMRLSFATNSPDVIEEGLNRLATALTW